MKPAVAGSLETASAIAFDGPLEPLPGGSELFQSRVDPQEGHKWKRSVQRRQACQEGRFPYWLRGMEKFTGEMRQHRARCNLRWCSVCSRSRGQRVYARCRDWLDELAESPTMLTLTLKRGGTMPQAWLNVWKMWREFWPRFCRRVIGLQRCRTCGVVRDLTKGRYPSGDCDGAAHKWGTVPYVAVLEAQKDGWPHFHVIIPVRFLETGPGKKDGVRVALGEWMRTWRNLTEGGWVWLSNRKTDGDPAKYVAKYVTKGGGWPDSLAALLTTRRVRTYNVSHTPAEERQTTNWVWKLISQAQLDREKDQRLVVLVQPPGDSEPVAFVREWTEDGQVWERRDAG